MRTGGEALPRELRIRKSSEYRRVYEGGRKIVRRAFVLFYLRNGTPYHRLGITATRRLGKAARRNRIKRKIREAFRRVRSGLGPAGVDCVFNARAGLDGLSVQDLIEEIRSCCVQIRKEMEPG